MEKHCIGIDVSAKSFVACYVELTKDGILRHSVSKKFDNNKPGFQQLMRFKRGQTKKGMPLSFLMEATGVYHEGLANFLHQRGEQVHVILPNTSKHYFKSLNIKTKTDAVDARILARFGVERNHREWTPPSELMLELKSLCRYKVQLQDQKTAMANIDHSKERAYGTPSVVRRSSKKILKSLDQQILTIEQEIVKVISSDPELKRKVDQVCTTKGLGIQTVAGILAETDCFKLFKSAKQLVGFAGYDVVHNESGSFKGATRISKKGNSYIRRLMYMPAMSASRSVPEFKALRDRIVAKSAIPMKGQVAVQRKLLCLIYTLWKNDSPYIENYHKKIAQTGAQATQDSAEALP